MRRSILPAFLFSVLAAGQVFGQPQLAAGRLNGQSRNPPNVLFIAVDDLRPELGCYGNEVIHSPNLNGLADRGVVFRNQFVTVPTCGPSRFSLLTGRWPRSREELSNAIFETRRAAAAKAAAAGTEAGGHRSAEAEDGGHRGDNGAGGDRSGYSGRSGAESPESFVEQLRRNGYYTVGIGKISHSADGYIYDYTAPRGTEMELPASWDEMLLDAGKWGTGWNAFFGYADGSNRNDRKKQVKPYERGEVDDTGYPDGLTAALAVKKLRELAEREQPFFLGVGFFKPHLPFNAPAKYWDLYEEADILLTPSPGIPENVHPASLHESAEFNQYLLGEEKASLEQPVSDAYARKLKHAYYASVSYVDAQIGKLLAELESLGLDKNTIIVVWGDHGWHLGDDRVWGKHTIFDWALRSVLIMKTPGGLEGVSREEVVSSVDIYPTLMQLCGADMPGGTDGESFVPLLTGSGPGNRGERASSGPGNRGERVAYSYFRNGITVRTRRYRLTRYFRDQQPVIELYDHRHDPYENHNIAGERPGIVKKLMPLLNEGNTGLYGPSGKDAGQH